MKDEEKDRRHIGGGYIFVRCRVVMYREGRGGATQKMTVLFRGGITKRAQLRGEEQGFGTGKRADK